VRQAKVFREKQGIDLRVQHHVEAVDRSAKKVKGRTSAGESFEVSYDKLLIATGARPIVPELPGFDLPGVMAVKTLVDGRRIKAFITAHDVKKVVLIGMGYIALEMCEALRERAIEVAMVKPRDRFLPWLNENLAAMVREELEANQVEIHLGHEVHRVEKSELGLKVVCSDLELDCQMVLVTIGVSPCSELAEDAGLELGPDKEIVVDRTLLTSDEHIYAAGDCADSYHVVTGQRTWIPLALRANRAGWAAADNVIGKRMELQGVAGTAVFKTFDMEVARTGLTVPEAERYGFEPAEVMIKARTRAHAHPGSCPIGVQLVGDTKSGRLLGAQLVSKDRAAHRVNAPAVALHAKMTVEEFSQSDLAYAPPFGPTWDPTLTAANQLLKKM
jgi:NADPH-dependent 2,4-dienoyl-CoA reductase/sulfur reductase-like enzyme